MTPRGEPCRVPVHAAAPETPEALQLEARSYRGELGFAVVAPPHPLYGGTIDSPVVLRIVQALARAKLGALSFNFRGVDGSEGRASDDLGCAVADYAAAVAHARTMQETPVLIGAGYSFGAGTALLFARHATGPDKLSTLVLVAPPVGMLLEDDLRAFSGKLIIAVGDDDEYAPLDELQRVLAARPATVLEVIPGADHFFHFGGLGELEQRLAKHLVS